MLYPPQIEGTLPSFWIKEGAGTTVTVPFSMNRAVGQNEVFGFELKVKSIIKNEVILTIESSSYNFTDNEVYFKLSSKDVALLNIGQFYKFQLAYIDKNGKIGYYSTVGVVKCTSQPTIKIKGLEEYSTNMHKYSYIGYYENQGDLTEKVYSYRFILTDHAGNVVRDSGEKIHNVQTNVHENSSTDTFTFSFDLDKGKVYFLQYIVTTNNKMVLKTCKYRLLQQDLIPMKVPVELHADLDFDNGYVDLKIIAEQDAVLNYYVTGNFIITKSSNLSNFKEWDKVATVRVAGRGPVYLERRDFAVEQGQTYIYALQQFNDYEMLSERKTTEKLLVDFEDAFLTDGDCSLRIRFNPKIATFKTDRLEQKIDTIGGKFPFIFRNDIVEYKEFSISGLISYKMDENNLFITDDELQLKVHNGVRRSTGDDVEHPYTMLDSICDNLRTKLYDGSTYWVQWRAQQTPEALVKLNEEYMDYAKQLAKVRDNFAATDLDREEITKDQYKTFDLTPRNYAGERIFKIKVLDWLNNGKPKMFRSPGEGNYIVRLMNVSLAPVDSLGRLLHTFTATAYEVADFTYENLLYYDLIRVDNLVFNHLLLKTIPLSKSGWASGADWDPDDDDDEFYKYLFDENGDPIKIPTDEVEYTEGELLDGNHLAFSVYFTDMIPGTSVLLDGEEIVVGATGSYYAEYENGLSSIIIPDNNYYIGNLTYSYYGRAHQDFDLIINESIQEHACRQFIGPQEDIVSQLNDIKTELLYFYNLSFNKRQIIDCEYTHHEQYYDEYGKRVYFADEYKPQKFYEYIEESNNYEICIDAVCDLDKIYYMDILGEEPVSFLDEEDKEFFNLKYVDGFYYPDMYNETTNIFDNSNYLPLYRFTSDNIIIDGEEYQLEQPLTIYKDSFDGKYLVTKEVYNNLDNEIKDSFSIYSNQIKFGIKNDNDEIVYDTVDITYDEHYDIENETKFDSLSFGNGVYLNCAYKTRVITYAMEDETTDEKFFYYTDNLKYILSVINKNDLETDELAALDITNLQDILTWYQENLVLYLDAASNGLLSEEEYNKKTQEYLDVLDFYEQYLSGELNFNLVDLSSYAQLEAIANKVLAQIDNARKNYYPMYEKYVRRLTYLIEKYREEGDYAND